MSSCFQGLVFIIITISIPMLTSLPPSSPSLPMPVILTFFEIAEPDFVILPSSFSTRERTPLARNLLVMRCTALHSTEIFSPTYSVEPPHQVIQNY